MAPWLLGLLPGGRAIMPMVAVCACLTVIAGTLYLTRAMDAVRIPMPIQRGVILIGMVGASVLAWNAVVFNVPGWANWAWLQPTASRINGLVLLLPEAIIATMGVAWLCWRGLQLADRLPNIADVARSFQVGVVMLSLLVVVNVEHDLTIFVPAYFFCQLLVVSLTRVEMITRERGGKHSDHGASGWWVAILVGSTGAVILLACLISAVILGIGPDELLMRLWPLLSLLAAPVILILAVFVGLVGMMLEIIIRPLQDWLARVSTQFFNLPPGLDNPVEKMKRAEATSHIAQYVEIAVVILVVLAVLVGVVRSMRQRRQHTEGQDELRESVWPSNVLLIKLRQQLQNRLAQLRNLADIAGRLGTSGLFAVLTIRRIYAQTVKLAASHGYPRPASSTPYEHLHTLQQVFPGCEPELAQITEAYVGVHYGELPERPDALAEIRVAFERVATSRRPH